MPRCQGFVSFAAFFTVEPFPEIAAIHAPAGVLAGSFALGSLFMYALKLWTLRMERRDGARHASAAAPGLDRGLVAATFVDPETPVSTLILFGGFFVFWCIRLIADRTAWKHDALA